MAEIASSGGAENAPTTRDGMLAFMRARSLDGSPFTRLLGVELERCWAGEADASLEIRADLTQHRGTVHGGVLGALADNVAGWAAASVLGPLVTTSFTIHLLAAARAGRLLAFGKVAHLGRRSAVVRTEIFADHEGSRILVAVASVAFSAKPAR